MPHATIVCHHVVGKQRQIGMNWSSWTILLFSTKYRYYICTNSAHFKKNIGYTVVSQILKETFALVLPDFLLYLFSIDFQILEFLCMEWPRIGTSHTWIFTSGEVHIFRITVKIVGEQAPWDTFLSPITGTAKIAGWNSFRHLNDKNIFLKMSPS